MSLPISPPSRRVAPRPGRLSCALVLTVLLVLTVASLATEAAVGPGRGAGATPLPHAVATVPSSGLGARFPAPNGGPDPTPASAASPAVVRQLEHETVVASLVAHHGAGYSYASGVAWLAYAPWDQSFYVAAPPSSVDVIPAGSTSPSNVIAVGADPFGVAVDPATQQVWVTNSGSNNVSVINGTTQSPTAGIHVGSQPLGIAVDPIHGRVFVAASGTNVTSAISVATQNIVWNQSVRPGPAGVAFDPATNRVFVTDQGSDAVSVLNGTTGRPIGNVTVGQDPYGVALDNATDAIYVANEGSSNVSVIDAATDTLAATVPVVANGYFPDLQGVTYDSLHHLVWVTAGASAVVINATEERAVDEIIYDPAGIAYDPSNGDVCLTNSANRTFGCFVFGSRLQPDANVTFTETGLPAGTTWNVTLGAGGGWNGGSATQSINGSSFVFGVDEWTHLVGYNYSFSVEPAAGLVPDLLQGYVVNSGTTPSWVNLTFRAGSVYGVQFQETGLSTGTEDWSVSLGGINEISSGTSVTYQEANGTYPFSTSGPPGMTSSPSTGNVSVAGHNVTVPVAWSSGSTGGGSGGVFALTFDEAGLTSGTRWVVNVTNATADFGGAAAAPSNLVWDVHPGVYDYMASAPVGWNSTVATGTATVTNASVTVDVAWTWVGYYPVTFNETGLPSGTLWGVEIASVSNSSQTRTVVLDESNGSYPFTILPVSGYTARTTNRSVVVDGSPVTVTVQWTLTVVYGLTFQESGLANGTEWNVMLSGPNGTTSLESTTTSIGSSEPNGTYEFTVPPIVSSGRSEYVASPANGSVAVSGSARTIDIAFSLSQGFYNVTFAEHGLPSGVAWSIGVGGEDIETTGSTVVAAERNGTYAFTLGGAFGYDPAPAFGNVTVQGQPVYVGVNFSIAPTFYPVTFTETGLGSGTAWSITLGATLTSTLPSIVFAEANGSYPYTVGTVVGYAIAASSGTVDVNGAAPPTVDLTFVSTDEYAVVFTETGLPSGTGWAVSIGSQLDSALGTQVALLEPNGTFGYFVLPVTGYTTHFSGFVTVAGGNVSVAVPFVPQTYPVVVVEFGLPNGTRWSVAVTNASTGFNATFSTTSSALIVDLPNGTYALTVSAGGYNANLSAPSFTVAGKLLGGSPTVRFTAPARPPGGGALFAASATTLGLVAAGLILGGAALGLVAAAWRRRAAQREGMAWVGELSNPPGGDSADRREP